ncbi:MAG: hypothetical protein FVQ78_10345 [Solirubrobacterales bacterium]|nr:hypothetical protein [Solirubrobacterales bacterium]
MRRSICAGRSAARSADSLEIVASCAALSSARLRRELRGLGVAIDLVLVTDRHVEEWGHFEGTMLNDALREGRVLAAA